MIHNQSLSAVMTSAQALTDSKVVLEAVPGSPLADMVYHCAPLEAFGVAGAAVVGDDIEAISGRSMYKDLNGAYPHDDCMAEFVEIASRVIEGNFNLTKNVVNPMIIKVVEDATSYADARARSAISPMNIVPIYYPAPYNNQALREVVSRYEQAPSRELKLELVFPAMSAEKIREMVKTGIPTLDADIATWIGALSDSEIESTYNAVFGDREQSLPAALADRILRPGKALLVFLLARHFYDEIPEGLNISLSDYKVYMSALAEQSGQQVAAAFRMRQDNDRRNQLLLSTPYRGEAGLPVGDVLVNGDVYGRWLKEGGVPESIFGAIHGNADDRSYKSLIDNASTYVETWTRAFKINKARVEFDRFNHFLEGMRQALLSQLAQLPKDYRNTPEDRVYKERITEHLVKVKEGGVDEPWAIARKLVCRVFFSHTEAERVSWAIANVCKKNPEMPVREAALLAAVEIVPEWIAQQFTVKNF